MKLGEIVVHMDNYNFTKFHQNQKKNKKVLLIACFSVQNSKVSVELWKSYIVCQVQRQPWFQQNKETAYRGQLRSLSLHFRFQNGFQHTKISCGKWCDYHYQRWTPSSTCLYLVTYLILLKNSEKKVLLSRFMHHCLALHHFVNKPMFIFLSHLF